MTLALRQRPLARVVAGIVRANDGALFDPSDLSTLYQDAAGTTPVTAVEQPVGLMLDKSRGMTLGPELVSNGTFDSGTEGWTAPSGAFAVVGGRAEITGASGFFPHLTQAITTTAGRWYKVSVPYEKGTYTGPVYMNFGSDVSSSAASGTLTGYFLAGGASTAIVVGEHTAASTGTVYFDNISVRELYGYHATQSITASRPVLSARYNLLTKTEDFANAVWVKVGGGTGSTPVVTQNYALSPDGMMNATRVILARGSGTTPSDYSVLLEQLALSANVNFNESIYVKLNTGAASIAVYAVLSGSVDLLGTKIIDISNQWVRIDTSFITASTGNHNISIGIGGSLIGTTQSADILIWHPQLNIGTTPLPYQRVNTATDYDTDPRYFPKYLKFDGIDDYMNLPYMGLYAAGACSIVVAMSENKVAYGTSLINETNSTLTAPMYNPTRQSDIGNNWRSLIRNDANVVTLSSTGALINADGHISVRSRIERESNTAAFENSINKESYNYARAGTLTLDKTTIGALLLGGVMGSPDNMNLYGLIITKSALTDSQRIACERYLGRKSGVQL